MHIALEIEELPFSDNQVTVIVTKHFTINKSSYEKTIATFIAPKYQAFAIRDSLKRLEPQEYKNNVLELVVDNGS